MTADGAATTNRFNLTDELLDRHIREGRADRIAIYYLDETWTYGQVADAASRAGNALRGLGVRMEERVVIMLPDSPQYAAILFGIIKIGAVAIPLSTLLTPGDYLTIFNDCRARVAVIHADQLSQIEPVRGDLEFLEHVVVMGGDAGAGLGLDQLLKDSSPELTAAPTVSDDAALWQYSSGTTGQPKGVIHMQHGLIYSADMFGQKVLGLTENDRTFSVARLFFGYGLGNGLAFPFRVGGASVLTPHRPDERHVLEVVARYRPTAFFGVPTSYAAMLEVKDIDRYDWSSVRVCVSAGEALPTAVWERWRDRMDLEIVDGIGCTEALHIFCANRPGEIIPGSVGRPVPGYDVRIVDDGLQDLPPGEIGNLLVRGNSIAAGYWNKHEQTRTAFLGEWLKTGDKLSRDDDGALWFSGRSDDMIKAGGIWVSPAEVESAVGHHPAVVEAAVIGRQDPEGLVKPKAFVVLREGWEPSDQLAEDIAAFVKGRIAAYKFPRWVQFVNELPKTPTGKVQRFLLRRLDEET